MDPPTEELEFSSGYAFVQGVKALARDGITPDDLVFVAFDPHGRVKLQVVRYRGRRPGHGTGHKLTLASPFGDEMYYLDAVHPVDDHTLVVNGDRRIGGLALLPDVATWLAWFVRKAGRRAVFFGCTPHMPGSWWVQGRDRTEPLHGRGYVDLVLHPTHGLLARRSLDPHLYLLDMVSARRGDLDRWARVYTSPLGNLLMLERRVIGHRLLLTCEHGLVELDLGGLPAVRETGLERMTGGLAVVGRTTDGAFAVTRGVVREWGLEAVKPAVLVSPGNCPFPRLCELLDKLNA